MAILATFRFDYEYYVDYGYDIFSTTKFLIGFLKIVIGSNLVAVPLFTTRIAEDLAINITSSKARNSC